MRAAHLTCDVPCGTCVARSRLVAVQALRILTKALLGWGWRLVLHGMSGSSHCTLQLL